MGACDRFGQLLGPLIAGQLKRSPRCLKSGRRRLIQTIGRFPVQWIQVNSYSGDRELPLYPYRCTQCGHRFEKIQRFKDEPEKVCPKCGGVLERPLTAPGLSFKGAGWYVNDYASKSSSSSGDAAVSGDKTGKSSEAKPESKTETKSETKAASGSESSTASSAPAAPTPGSSTSKD
jgi:putative FmdB family regulatory protein